ncbi:MAG: type II toxin-antitoxin system HicB family antitoxin [Nitrospirota bacterium]
MKDTLSYKKYIGSVRFSTEDMIFHGKLEGISDLILYEGQSVDELVKAFHDAVDDYLEFCRSKGKTPEKSYKGSFNVRIPSELHRRALQKAAMEGVSLNHLVKEAIEREVAV